MKNDLEKLTEKIQTFGKEDLSDILYYTATSLKSIFECHIVRVYLEDLHQGILICQYMTEQKRPVEQQITKFISPRDSMTSQAFYENKVIRSWNLPEGFIKYRNPFEKMLGVQASVVFPIVHELRPIGTLTLDWEKEGNPISNEKIDAINSFLTNISVVIDRAKRFHQQISFSRHLDLARKKEAAWMIVRSAVKLIDKVALASVFIPASSKFSNLNQANPTDLVEIIAVYSKNKEDLPKYLDKEMLSVLNDENLINRIVKYSKKNGLVARKNNQSSIYIKNIWEENFTEYPRTKNIQSVVLLSDFKGYVVIEAQDPSAMFAAIQNIRHVRGQLRGELTYDDIEKYLIKKSTVSELAVENTVEIIGGPFKGMKATITRLDQEKEEATVVLSDAAYQLPVTIDANYLKLVTA